VEKYRLAPLRTVRDRDERAHRGALAAAVGDARDADDAAAGAARRADDARAVLATAVAARASLVDAGASPSLLALAERHAQRRRREHDAAVGEHLRARAAHAGRLAAVDEARGRLAIARRERELIERHFERWRDQQRKLADRRED
jgi:hypothetical protein